MNIGHYDAVSGEGGFGFWKGRNIQGLHIVLSPSKCMPGNQVMSVGCHYLYHFPVPCVGTVTRARGMLLGIATPLKELENSYKEPKRYPEPYLVDKVTSGAVCYWFG